MRGGTAAEPLRTYRHRPPVHTPIARGQLAGVQPPEPGGPWGDHAGAPSAAAVARLRGGISRRTDDGRTVTAPSGSGRGKRERAGSKRVDIWSKPPGNAAASPAPLTARFVRV